MAFFAEKLVFHRFVVDLEFQILPKSVKIPTQIRWKSKLEFGRSFFKIFADFLAKRVQKGSELKRFSKVGVRPAERGGPAKGRGKLKLSP